MKGCSKKMCMGETGSVQVVEMTLIFPLVIMFMGFLIYAACYVLQGVIMFNEAQRIAIAASREAAIPGYRKLYNSTGGVTSKADFAWNMGETIDKAAVDQVMNDRRPYRYFLGDAFLRSDDKSALEANLESLIASGSFLAASSVDCQIYPHNHFVSQTIEVVVTKEIATPRLLQYLGLTSALDINVKATAIVSDPAEFVRNTDMIFDLTDFLLDNIKIGSSGETLAQRIQKFKDKFNGIKQKIGITWDTNG